MISSYSRDLLIDHYLFGAVSDFRFPPRMEPLLIKNKTKMCDSQQTTVTEFSNIVDIFFKLSRFSFG
jgi:hypothetical protein